MKTHRRHLLRLLALSTVSALVAAPALAVELEGVSFTETAKAAGQDLVLNGTGLRAVGPFKGYVVGLYLPKRADTAQAAVAQGGAKRLRLGILMGAPAKELAKALMRGISKNLGSPDELAKLQPRLNQLEAHLLAAKEVRKGDVVHLDFEPQKGMVFTLNGKAFGEPLAGADLYAAVLQSFVGEHPYQNEMRAGLLGRAR